MSTKSKETAKLLETLVGQHVAWGGRNSDGDFQQQPDVGEIILERKMHVRIRWKRDGRVSTELKENIYPEGDGHRLIYPLGW